MSIKLFSLAKELNIGVNSLVNFFTDKGKEVENNPNARISEEDFELVLSQFTPSFDEETIMRVKKKFTRKSDAPKTKTPAQSADKPSPALVEPPMVSVVDEPAITSKLKVKGKIQLDEKNNPIPPTKTAAPIEARELKEEKLKEEKLKEEKLKEENKKKIVADKELPAEPVEQKVKNISTPDTQRESGVKSEVKVNPKPEIKVNTKLEVSAPIPIKEEGRSAKVIKTESKDDQLQQIEKPDAVTSKPLTEETPISNKEVEPEIFRLNSEPEPQVKVLGKIDLSAFESGRNKRGTVKEKDKDTKRKRKRITAGAVDVTREAAKLPADKQDCRHRSTRQNNSNERSHGGGRQDHRSLKATKRQEPVLTPEQEDELRARQVKETLAQLNSKQTAFGRAAKSRREKREARRAVVEKELELSSREEKVLKLTEFVTVNDLAVMMGVSATDVISTCMSIDMMVSINQRLDAETINIVAEEFGFETEFVSANVIESLTLEEDTPDQLQSRPPVITIMGHVDHGKTSLIDRIRRSDIAAGEAGGITQHIGAYNVRLSDGRRITLLDTPGHEAFTAMRARGAQVTDLAIIVVAANDAVMPQTIEAINHAAAAGVPILFAINKIDVSGAQPDKIREQLANMNYLVEDWGGKYQVQEISAKQNIGIPDLLDKVLLEAEILDLKANPDRRAVGSVIESSLDKGKGYLATVLVQNGTLRVGDYVLAGKYYGRVKAMYNEYGKQVKEATPSQAVSILGFNGAPSAGDDFNVMDSEQDARSVAVKREQLQREQGLRTQKMLTLDDIGRRIAIGNFKQFNVILKGDVDGSVQALANSLIELSSEEVQVNVISQGVGQISESDVLLATTSDAVIIAFQVRPSAQARKLAEQEGVEIRSYSVIYDAIEDVRDALEGMLSPEIKEQFAANLEVHQIFKVSKVGTIAGCIVTEGKIRRTDKVRVIRDGIVIFTGELASLKRFKDEAKEVVAGLECGINIKNYNNIEVGDVIEAFEEIEVRKKL